MWAAQTIHGWSAGPCGVCIVSFWWHSLGATVASAARHDCAFMCKMCLRPNRKTCGIRLHSSSPPRSSIATITCACHFCGPFGIRSRLSTVCHDQPDQAIRGMLEGMEGHMLTPWFDGCPIACPAELSPLYRKPVGCLAQHQLVLARYHVLAAGWLDDHAAD
jgi:hypothetical protein